MPHSHKPQENWFFTQDGTDFLPAKGALGYWLPGTLNGSAVASLLALVLEQRHGEPGLVPVRFSVDLLGMARAEPLQVDSHVIKSGGRLRLAEATIHQNGTLIARASIQFLRETHAPTNPTWQSPPWGAPHPDMLAATKRRGSWELRPIPADHARVDRTLSVAADPAHGNPPVLGALSPLENRQTWLFVDRQIVAGVAHTPFTRLALAGDFASPLAHSSEAGIDYVNSDFTIYAHRMPVGEWLGFEHVGHSATRGVAIGECWVHDLDGPVATINVSALAQLKRG
jgi:hypothetical protein